MLFLYLYFLLYIILIIGQRDKKIINGLTVKFEDILTSI